MTKNTFENNLSFKVAPQIPLDCALCFLLDWFRPLRKLFQSQVKCVAQGEAQDILSASEGAAWQQSWGVGVTQWLTASRAPGADSGPNAMGSSEGGTLHHMTSQVSSEAQVEAQYKEHRVLHVSSREAPSLFSPNQVFAKTIG